MVIELKLKCYTCLDPIAPAGPADLTCFQDSDLDHRSNAQCLISIIDHQHTNNWRQTYTKQTRLQLEQYTSNK